MNITSKVILLGKYNVGKTSLIRRYVDKTYTVTGPTIGTDVCVREETVEGTLINLEIWDTAGTEKYDAMNQVFYRNSVAAILCYDITDKSSFDKACFWYMDIQHRIKDCKIFVCGTKKDLVDANPIERQVTSETLKILVDEQQLVTFEVSSRTGENVEKLFYAVAEYCIQKNKDEIENKKTDTDTMQLTENGRQPVKKPCC